jgi:hypothetical protein
MASEKQIAANLECSEEHRAARSGGKRALEDERFASWLSIQRRSDCIRKEPRSRDIVRAADAY